MAAVFSGSLLLLLLLVHASVGVFNVKSISEHLVKAKAGQMVSVACPSQAIGKDDIVTWETDDGEFLGSGKMLLIGSVHKSTNFICRRRSLRTGTIISAPVRLQLVKRSQSDGRIYLRRFDWTNIRCVDSPKGNYFFEWTNPKHFQVSKDNVLHIQLVEDSDFGYYTCRPYNDLGPLPIKEVYIFEDTSRPYIATPSRQTEAPWRDLEDLQLKVASGGVIAALCLPGDYPSAVKVQWRAPDGASFEGNRLMKRVQSRADFGDYSCQAIASSGGRWRRRVVVQNKASDKSADIMQNDYWPWRKAKPTLSTIISTPATKRTTFTTTTSSTTHRPRTARPRRSRPVVIRMQKVEYVIDKRAVQPTECPKPGDVGRFPGYTESRVYWIHNNQVVSEGSILDRWYAHNSFGNYECWRIYRNEAGDVRKILIPVILVEMPTVATEQPPPTTTKAVKYWKEGRSDIPKIYELAPQTIKVFKNETVMLVCPTDASITASPLNLTLHSFRQIWRDQRGVIGNKKSIFVSTQHSAKTDMKYSCQHDFYDEQGRIISLIKNYTLRSSSNQIESQVGERQNILMYRFMTLRLLCVSNSREGDNYEWIHPSGQPVSISNLLERFVGVDEDFGEYKCTVWRADGTSRLRKVRVHEKLPKRAKTVTQRRFGWLNLLCMENPPAEAAFEWIHPKQTVVSRKNRLRLQLKETADFGHYVCYASTSRGSLPATDFMVLEYPVSPYDKVTPQPPTTTNPGFVRLNPGDWVTLRCSNDPQPGQTFEWVNPNFDIVSWKNVFKRQLKESDFGHYICHIYVESVHIRSRHVSILKVGGGIFPDPKRRKVYMRRKEVTYFKCLERHPGNFLFEWTNPEGFVVSQKNVLQISLLKDADFGHYICKAISEFGQVQHRNVYIEEDQTQLLTRDPQTPEVIKAYQLETINISCMESPPLQTSFEWVDERGFIRSTSNVLSLTVMGRSDTGKFTCTATSASVQLSRREVIIVIKPIGLQLTPESGIIKACKGQASVSALCWIENRQTAPLWRELRHNDSRVETSVLRHLGRRARLTLFDVDISDNGRVFECFSRALRLSRQVTVRVKACESCACLPSEKPCLANGVQPPQKQCINVNWICDGEDDCGNGYDERNCPFREINLKGDQCEGQTLRCSSSQKVIPRGFWCDGEADCSGGEDEVACQTPQILLPSSVQRVVVRLGAPVSLNCTAIGVPPPELIWRFNWDCLPSGVRPSCACIKQDDMYATRCMLTIAEMTPELLGIFTCEAINSRGRAFAEDYELTML